MRTTKIPARLALGSAAVLVVLGLAPVAAALADDPVAPAPSGDGVAECVTETVGPAETVAGGEISSAVAERVCD